MAEAGEGSSKEQPPAPSGSGSNKPVSAGRSAKLLEKIEADIKNKEFYEAHQGYRALYQRYNAQGKKNKAMQLLHRGAMTLLEHQQVRVCVSWSH